MRNIDWFNISVGTISYIIGIISGLFYETSFSIMYFVLALMYFLRWREIPGLYGGIDGTPT